MSEYAITVICTVALILLGTLVSYGEDDQIMRLAFSVILTAAVLLPIAPIISELAKGELPSPAPPAADYTEEYKATAESAFCEGVESALCTRYNIDEDDIKVAPVGFDFETMRCERINVILSGRAALKDLTSIKGYLEKNFEGCDIRLEIE